MADREHVAKLKQGVTAWNEWRRQSYDGRIDLTGADLSGLDLRKANLGDADLSNAKLIKANLEHALLYNATLQSCSLNRANFSFANLFGADLSRCAIRACKFDNAFMPQAKLVRATVNDSLAIMIGPNANTTSFIGADLGGADFRKADLSFETTLRGADLGGARFDGAKLKGADLTDANLSDARGFEFDQNPCRGARISAHAKDRWSVLRRKYTGINMLINLVFFLLFLAPLVVKGSALQGLSYFQQQMIDAGIFAETTRCSSATGGVIKGNINGRQIETPCQSMPMWKLLLGFRGPYGIWMPILSIILILYQIGRYRLTLEVSSLRDAEERSGVSPPQEGLLAYPNLYRAHLVLQVVYWISLFTFMLRAIEFLFLTDVTLRGNVAS